MEYANIKPGKFIERVNRFVAHIEIEGRREVCHVKNTGRCGELFVPGAAVFVREQAAATRKTRYDLISVYKGERLINVDSQAPNKVFYEWMRLGNLFGKDALIRPETRYGDSRFDFYAEEVGRKAYIEVKGVTLERDNTALFPDAPTERGIKHINGLRSCLKDGCEAVMAFVVQMSGVDVFMPNTAAHKAFGDALRAAEGLGVKVMALDCLVSESGITAGRPVSVEL